MVVSKHTAAATDTFRSLQPARRAVRRILPTIMGQHSTATLAAVAGAAAGAAVLLQRWLAARALKPSSREPTCDFVMMGVNGFIGAKMLDAVREAKYDVVVVPKEIRLHQRETLHAFLAANRPRHGVICCSGTRGNPNIDWCDSHPVETIDANITGQLNVATICWELELHCALVGTAFVYQGIDGKIYTEEDAPDSQLPKAYIKLRIALEQVRLPASRGDSGAARPVPRACHACTQMHAKRAEVLSTRTPHKLRAAHGAAAIHPCAALRSSRVLPSTPILTERRALRVSAGAAHPPAPLPPCAGSRSCLRTIPTC